MLVKEVLQSHPGALLLASIIFNPSMEVWDAIT